MRWHVHCVSSEIKEYAEIWIYAQNLDSSMEGQMSIVGILELEMMTNSECVDIKYLVQAYSDTLQWVSPYAPSDTNVVWKSEEYTSKSGFPALIEMHSLLSKTNNGVSWVLSSILLNC